MMYNKIIYPSTKNVFCFIKVPVGLNPTYINQQNMQLQNLQLNKKCEMNMSVVIQQSNNLNPNICFSEAAINHLISYLSKNPDYQGVRLSVKKTGCSGFSYVVDYVTEPSSTDFMIPLTQKYMAWIDKNSYPFLKDMNVDYVKQGLNSKFIFNNPNQTGQCGCGESFTVS